MTYTSLAGQVASPYSLMSEGEKKGGLKEVLDKIKERGKRWIDDFVEDILPQPEPVPVPVKKPPVRRYQSLDEQITPYRF